MVRKKNFRLVTSILRLLRGFYVHNFSEMNLQNPVLPARRVLIECICAEQTVEVCKKDQGHIGIIMGCNIELLLIENKNFDSILFLFQFKIFFPSLKSKTMFEKNFMDSLVENLFCGSRRDLLCNIFREAFLHILKCFWNWLVPSSLLKNYCCIDKIWWL